MASNNKHRKNIAHNKAIKEIAEHYNINESVVKIIIRRFFLGLKKLMIKNEEINIKGLFSLNLSSHYKKKVLKHGKGINLRKRKNSKKYNRK